MDSMKAFAMGEAARARGDKSMVFDWFKAAEIIKERQPSLARAGLRDDWEWTGGDIYRDGSPVPEDETYTYLASIWAVPELCLDGEIFPCWIWEADSPGWYHGTYWPEGALKILNG